MDQYKTLVTSLLEKGLRHDSRKLMDYRPIEVEINPIPRANGSARVTIGKTEVIVGVKFDVGTPFPDTPDEGVMMVGAELSPLANPDFEPGPPGPAAVELARVVDRGIRESHCIDFTKLCIKEKEKVWMVFVDIYPMNDDGNLLDAAALAAVVALKNAVLPKYDEKEEKVLFKEMSKKKLDMSKLPVLVTFAKNAGYIFIDPDRKEENILDSRLSVSSLADGTLVAMQKGGQGTMTKAEILNLFDLAVEKAKEHRKLIK